MDEADGVEVVEAEQHFGDDRADLVLVEPALVHCTYSTRNCIGSQTLIIDMDTRISTVYCTRTLLSE